MRCWTISATASSMSISTWPVTSGLEACAPALVGGVDLVGHHGQREVAVGDHADRPAALADDHRADVAVAHQLAHAAQGVARRGGHHALRHHLRDAHGGDCIVRPVTIVLYGATGYTGRLVTDELARRGLDHVLSGRDPEKLARLEGAPTRAACRSTTTRALRDLLEGAAVVINCAGPFTLAGDALVRAAIATGTHYVDSTGEQTFIRMVFDRHGGAAERAGVALVPALGFDYALGDCIARLAAAGLEPLDELVLAYAVEGFGMTRGTLRSGLEMMKGGDVVYEDEQWRRAPGGVFKASFDFPEPIGRQPMSRYPSGEVITVPHHTRTRKVTSLLPRAPRRRRRCWLRCSPT